MSSHDNSAADKTAIPAAGILYRIGQIIGVSSGVASSILWTLAMWDPASGLSFSFMSFAVVFIMILIGIFSIIASLKGHSTVLVVLFAIAFFPVGLYMLGVPHWLQWAGLANVGLLFAALLLRRGSH
jgi:hypothetical protein